jgi:hypothetical protein
VTRATLALLLASACGDAPTETKPKTPPPAVIEVALWVPVAEGLTKTCDEPAGICCYRTTTNARTQRPDGVALSCVRVAPLQWQIAPGPKVGRAP